MIDSDGTQCTTPAPRPLARTTAPTSARRARQHAGVPVKRARRTATAGRSIAALGDAAAAATDDGCKDTLLAGDLVITEVFADYKAPTGGTGADEGKEWFEIYNASDRPIELTGLTIVHSRPDGSTPRSRT